MKRDATGNSYRGTDMTKTSTELFCKTGRLSSAK